MRAVEIRRQFAAVVAEHGVKTLAFCGAHDAEEAPALLAAGVEHLTLIEPIPLLAAKLRTRYHDHPAVEVIECACSDRVGSAPLTVMTKTNMSSLLAPMSGDVSSVILVSTRRLDALCPDAEGAVVDVQGHEFEVLAAAPWDSLRLLMVETLHGVEDAALSPPYNAMVDYMAGKGFAEVDRYVRDYDFIQKWAYGRTTTTGAEVRDVVFARTDSR